MLTEHQAIVNTPVWFYDNKAKRIETEITSLVFTEPPSNEQVVRCKGEKKPIPIKYLSLIEVGTPVEEILVETVETLPAIIIKDIDETTLITPELLRDRFKDNKALKIANILDTKGYDAVKAAKQKAVKTRTYIKGKEDDVIKAIKSRHSAELKEVTDYTSQLYKECIEAQTDAETKLLTIDNARAAEATRLANEEKARTEGREAKMFSLGMSFNGQVFFGYGRQFTKEQLHGWTDEFYNQQVESLEASQLESEVSGEVKPMAEPTMQKVPVESFVGQKTTIPANKYVPYFDNEVYKRILNNGQVVILTKGKIEADGFEVLNDRILESAIYLSIK